MLKNCAATLASVLIVGALSIPAQAGIIYDNGASNAMNGYSIHTPDSSADDFELSADANITGIGFYFANNDGINGWDQDVDYSFYANDGGLLGVLLASGSAQNLVATDTGVPWCCGLGGDNVYLVTFNLQSAFAASAGTTYWLQLSGANSTTAAAYWVTTDPNVTNTGTNPGLTSGISTETEFAFYLTNDELSAVPEPSTLGIVGLGVLVLPALRRFRKSASTN